MKKKLLLAAVFLFTAGFSFSKDYKITSPDGKISVTVSIGKEITWAASYNNSQILSSTRTTMVLSDGMAAGENDGVKKSVNGKFNDLIMPVVASKHSQITDNYNFLSVNFRSGFILTFRAYNDGIAYRFETAMKDSVTVKNEISDISFPPGTITWYPLEKGFMSHNENTFTYGTLDTIGNSHLASLPALFKTGEINILITESGIEDYPGM